jgi:signal transduction histidine kinase
MDHAIQDKRFSQIFWVHTICEIWFLFIYVFVHKTTDYVLINSLVVLSNFILLYFYKQTRNYEKYAGIMFLIGSFYTAMLVYSAGAKYAPAPFGLALIPMVSAFFLGTRFLKHSFGLALFLFASVMTLGEYFPPPAIELDYMKEKILNTVVFIGVFFYCARSFVHSLEQKDKKIQKQKDEIQNLLRIVIHDIASPLTMALGRLSLKERKGENVDQLKHALENISDIISDVRRLEQISHGKLSLEIGEFSVNNLLEELSSEVAHRAEYKNLNIIIDCPHGLQYSGDYSLLKNNVLTNLLTNAIKFAEEGQDIKIVCRYETYLEISITDYGEGVPPEILSHIFQPDKPTTRKGTQGEQGSGFGMPIVKKIMEILGGDIQIKTNYPSPKNEVGTVVTIILPSKSLQKVAA